MEANRKRRAIDYLEYLNALGFDQIILREDEISRYRKLIQEIKRCKKCPLYRNRRNPVPGAGPINARLMIIGEAPGEKEDLIGLPFVGPSGQKLTLWLKEIGISRDDVYITNIVKCRPPHNREPTIEEEMACRPYLERQLEMIRPEIMLLLGNVALGAIKGSRGGITKLRGKIFDYGDIKVLPTFHPSYILSNPNKENLIREDFAVLKGLYYGK